MFVYHVSAISMLLAQHYLSGCSVFLTKLFPQSSVGLSSGRKRCPGFGRQELWVSTTIEKLSINRSGHGDGDSVNKYNYGKQQ